MGSIYYHFIFHEQHDTNGKETDNHIPRYNMHACMHAVICHLYYLTYLAFEPGSDKSSTEAFALMTKTPGSVCISCKYIDQNIAKAVSDFNRGG